MRCQHVGSPGDGIASQPVVPITSTLVLSTPAHEPDGWHALPYSIPPTHVNKHTIHVLVHRSERTPHPVASIHDHGCPPLMVVSLCVYPTAFLHISTLFHSFRQVLHKSIMER